MNIFTTFYVATMFRKVRYEPLTPYIKACTTSHKICVYALNRNKHTEFGLPSMFQA